jgi:DNA-binding GntR family transcriptional regulator
MTEPVRRSTADVVAERISKLIAEGELLPGQELRQASIAKLLSVSRVPVREALQSLVAAGVVRHVPDNGYTVARLSIAELAQVYELREMFEDEVLRAITSVDNGTVSELERLHAEMSALTGRDADIYEFQQRNLEFHMRIFLLSRLDLIVEELRRLWALSEPYRTMWAQDPKNRARSVAGHAEMLDAIRAGDLERLRSITHTRRKALASDFNYLLAG